MIFKILEESPHNARGSQILSWETCSPYAPIVPTTSGKLNFFFLNLNIFCSESAETQLEIEDLSTQNLGLQVVLYHPHPNSRCGVTVQTTAWREALENSEYRKELSYWHFNSARK